MSVHHKLEAIATLLDGVRWSRDRLSLRSRCPAHGGRGDTLSIRIHPIDDRIQLHCFAECGALEVLNAVGLDWSALYPDRPENHRMRRLPPLPYRDALLGIDHEAYVITIAAARLEAGHGLTRTDLDRLVLAASRVNAARRLTGAR